jgi:hypothetical protein
MIVHVKQATEIRLDDLVQVSAAFFFSGRVLDLILYVTLSQHDGDTSSSDGGSRSSKPPEYASEYLDVV